MLEGSTRIPIYVLPEHVTAVYRLLVELETPGQPETRAASTDEPVIGSWTRREIERAYVESPPGMRYILDGMIDRPDEELDADDLATFLHHKPDADAVTVRGTMGAFANRCAMRYQKPKRSFPFRHWYVDGGYSRYVMPEDVAAILRPLRKG